MRGVLTMLGAVSVGAGVMYLMDPERGHRRRADLRRTLTEVAESDLVERAVERARQVEPMAAMRDLRSNVSAMLPNARMPEAIARRAPAWLAPRRRSSILGGRDWALLGAAIGAVAAGLWAARRAMSEREGIEVVRTIIVDAPAERVYEFWNDFENFPRFMSHVREVRRSGPDRTHWVVAGPAGTSIEWDAIVTERMPNERISWRTVEGAVVEHSGTVRFVPAGNGTRIEVEMTYRPVGGSLGHSVAALFGNDPEHVIGEDLARLASQFKGPRPAVGESGSWR